MEIDDTALHSLCAQGASRPPSSGVTFDDTNRRVLLVRFLLYISCPPPPRSRQVCRLPLLSPVPHLVSHQCHPRRQSHRPHRHHPCLACRRPCRIRRRQSRRDLQRHRASRPCHRVPHCRPHHHRHQRHHHPQYRLHLLHLYPRRPKSHLVSHPCPRRPRTPRRPHRRHHRRCHRHCRLHLVPGLRLRRRNCHLLRWRPLAFKHSMAAHPTFPPPRASTIPRRHKFQVFEIAPS